MPLLLATTTVSSGIVFCFLWFIVFGIWTAFDALKRGTQPVKGIAPVSKSENPFVFWLIVLFQLSFAVFGATMLIFLLFTGRFPI